MDFDIHVEVSPLEGIADPQAKTIERALPVLGFNDAHRVRVGKVVRFSLVATDEVTARAIATEMCERLLANPVMEQFEIRIAGTAQR